MRSMLSLLEDGDSQPCSVHRHDLWATIWVDTPNAWAKRHGSQKVTLTDEFFDSLRLELEIASDRAKGASMAAYMKNKFSFFGVSSAD